MSSINSIVVVGLGYVGLPLALLADKKSFKVIGIDTNPSKIQSLKDGKSYIGDIPDDEVKNTKASFTDDMSRVSEADAVIICVPTPITSDKIPDLSPVIGAVTESAPHLKNGSLVVIESTINPGVCDEIVIPLIEKISGKKVGVDIYFAHCPERVNPGDPNWNVSNINRVVGANSQPELDLAVALYSKLIDAEIKPMGNIKEAEAVKIIENSFRNINIAFVNELAMSFHKLGINLENVVDGAATKPFSFMPHHPGCGVGGHCIPVDPYYLIEYAHNHGFEHEFLRLASNINESMPQFTVDLLIESLNKIGLPLKGSKITLLGLSYKANVGDERESPAHVIKDLLIAAEADLTIYDPYIENSSIAKSIDEALVGATAVIIATGHDEFRQINSDLLKKAGTRVLIDGRNILRHQKDNFISSGVIYTGIGI
jgi:nucleotide sugar dehydrogenase